MGELVRLVRPPVTGRSASFRLRFRFVRAVRAGEAKLCVRVRRASLTLGLGVAASARLGAVWRAIFAAICLLLNTFDSFVWARGLFYIAKSIGFSI